MQDVFIDEALPVMDEYRRLQETISAIKPLEEGPMRLARERQEQLTKPRGSLGRLEELAVHLAGIQGRAFHRMRSKALIVAAADHGVVEEGVSAYPREVTAQMVRNFAAGGAAINVLCRQVGARLRVVDVGVDGDLGSALGLLVKKIAPGTRNMSREPAMSREQAIRAVITGIEVLETEHASGLDVVGIGDMGIGNTTPSSAIVALVTGRPPEAVTGRGTGIGDAAWQRKVAVVKRALALHAPDPEDPLDVLAKVGGLEIGCLVGIILAGAARRVPVVLDGLITGAAALLAVGLCPTARDYLIASHCSAEPGHRAALEHLGLAPLLDLRMRLGEGTGAALALHLLEAATRLLQEMATFKEAGVTDVSLSRLVKP